MVSSRYTGSSSISISRRLTFGPFEWRRGQLRRDGKVLRLPPKETAVLNALVEARGLPVSRAELVRAAWGDAEVSAASLTRCIHALRRILALDDDQPVIETLHGQGFRLVLPVEDGAGGDTGAALEMATRDARALEFYLQAREFQGRRTAINLELAITALRRATMLDRTYAGAWLALARLHVTCCLRGLGHEPRTHAMEALAAADQALALAPGEAYAEAVRAWVRVVVLGDEAAFGEVFDTRHTSAPTFWEWRFCRAWSAASVGQFETALGDLQLADRLTPMRPGAVHAGGYLRFCAGHEAAALAYLREATATLPSSDAGWAARAVVAAWHGHHDEAIDAACRAMEIAEGLPMIASALAYALAAAGHRDRAAAMLADLRRHKGAHVPPTLEATVHVALGDEEAACAALARGAEAGCPYRGLARFDPRFEPLFRNRDCRSRGLQPASSV